MKLSLALLFFLSALHLFSQSTIDKFENKLGKLDSTSEHYFSNLILLAKEYGETDPEHALSLTQQAESQHLPDSLRGQLNIAKSTAYSYMAEYDTSLYFSFLALRIAERYADTITLMDAYNNIGIDFMFQGENEKAINYYKQVEALARSFKDSLRLGHALTNLGIVYSAPGNNSIELGYYKQAADIFEQIDEKDGLANTYLNSATVYIQSNEFERAEENLSKALDLFRTLNFSSGIQNTLQTMSENELAQKRYAPAENLALEALQIAKNNHLTQDIIYTYRLLEEISLATGNFQKAHEYLTAHTAQQEMTFTLEKSKQIEELKTKYETVKKEAMIDRLSLETDLQRAELQSTRNIILVGSGSALIIITLLILFYQLRTKNLIAEREAQILQLEALEKRLMELNIAPSGAQVELSELNSKIQTPLSDREFEVLKLSLEGMSNAEIADKIFVSISTVKFHLRNTYGKLGVNNRKEALDYVVKSS